MTQHEMKRLITDRLHKDDTMWYRIFDEMCDVTLGFHQYGSIEIRIDGIRYKIEWDRYKGWFVDKICLSGE